ncbi:unnamed protein product [Urochloa humidicola]
MYLCTEISEKASSFSRNLSRLVCRSPEAWLLRKSPPFPSFRILSSLGMEQLISAMRPSMASSRSLVRKSSRSFIQTSQIVKIGASATAGPVSKASTTFHFLETFAFLLFMGFMHLRGHKFRLHRYALWDAIQFRKLEHNFLSSTKRRRAAWH